MPGETIEIPSIPRETVRAARAVFSGNNFYILVGDQLKTILDGIQLESITDMMSYSNVGRITIPLMTFFQAIEGLTDKQATDAVRSRLDWKYALHLPINILSLHQETLCEFRQKVCGDSFCQWEFQRLVDRLVEINPTLDNELRKFDIQGLLFDICTVNLFNCAQESMSVVLGVLAGSFPEWLRKITKPHWYGRYSGYFSTTNANVFDHQKESHMKVLGTDIQYLLEELQHSNISQINEIQEIEKLRHIWEYQYEKWELAISSRDESTNWCGCDFCMNGNGVKGGLSSNLL